MRNGSSRSTLHQLQYLLDCGTLLLLLLHPHPACNSSALPSPCQQLLCLCPRALQVLCSATTLPASTLPLPQDRHLAGREPVRHIPCLRRTEHGRERGVRAAVPATCGAPAARGQTLRSQHDAAEPAAAPAPGGPAGGASCWQPILAFPPRAAGWRQGRTSAGPRPPAARLERGLPPAACQPRHSQCPGHARPAFSHGSAAPGHVEAPAARLRA